MTATLAGPDPVALCVNGKWLAQPASGTQRYATEVMRAISSTPIASQITLIVPKDAVQPTWATNFRTVRSRFRGQLFEQLALPWLSRGKHLYSLAGPAPLAKRDQTLVMHDAMPFRHPSTFRLLFVMWYHIMYGLLSRTAKRILTVSLFSRTELACVLRVPECRFQLAPCGADHVDPDPLGGTGTAIPFAPGSYALIVGNLAPHKNVIAAATALSSAGVAVVVVGSAQHVFRDVALETRRNICFLGRIDDRALQRLYSEAGVLVAPSTYEGFGLPIVEAGRLGCPSVYAMGSAMAEVAGDGGIGFPAEDLRRCVSLVEEVIFNRDLRESLGARARENAARFSWARTAETIFAPEVPVAETAPAGAGQSPLRVLHITETFSAGTGSAIIGYAKAIQGQGFESSLLAQDRGSGLFEELGESSPFARARIIAPGLVNLWRAIGTSVAEVKPDIVHLHSSLAGGVGRLRLMLKDKPIVVYSPHCFAFERRDISKVKRWAYRGMESLLARRTDAFVCVSPHEADLAGRLGSQADVVQLLNSFSGHRVPTGAEEPSATVPPVETIRIVTVGRVAPQKDPDMFVQIVSMLRAADEVEATWVGDGVSHARDRLELSGVAVTGWLPVQQVPAAIAGHSVYLHTAGWEAALPIAAIDAMDAGLPVVVRRNPAYRGMLPDDWQFDDALSAVHMIRALARQSTRVCRVREQFELMADLRKNCPELVLALEYRRLLQNSKDTPRNDKLCVDDGRAAARHSRPAREESQWRHRYSAL